MGIEAACISGCLNRNAQPGGQCMALKHSMLLDLRHRNEMLRMV